MQLKKTLFSKAPTRANATWVMVLLVVFSVFSILLWRDLPVADNLTASREQIFNQHQYWRLFTTLAVHGDIGHLLSNALFFIIFGCLLNAYFGALVFPVISLLLGALVNAAVLYTYESQSVIIGASGMIYMMAGFWIVLQSLIERRRSPSSRIFRAVGFVLILFFPHHEFEPHVSYLAHALGFLFGVIVGGIYFLIRRKYIRSFEVWEEDEFPEMDVQSMPGTEVRPPPTVMIRS